MKTFLTTAAFLVFTFSANAKDMSYYATLAPAAEIKAYMQDGPVTKCLIKARNTYATCIANAKNDKEKNKCLKALQKKVLSCQNAK